MNHLSSPRLIVRYLQTAWVAAAFYHLQIEFTLFAENNTIHKIRTTLRSCGDYQSWDSHLESVEQLIKANKPELNVSKNLCSSKEKVHSLYCFCNENRLRTMNNNKLHIIQTNIFAAKNNNRYELKHRTFLELSEDWSNQSQTFIIHQDVSLWNILPKSGGWKTLWISGDHQSSYFLFL